VSIILDPCEVCDGTGQVVTYSVADVSADEETEHVLICESCDGSGWGDE
jgi:RecJ-like exonuclease